MCGGPRTQLQEGGGGAARQHRQKFPPEMRGGRRAPLRDTTARVRGRKPAPPSLMCVPAGERFRGSPLVPRWAGLRRLGPRPAPRGRSPTAPQFPEKAQQVLFDLPIYTHPKYTRARRAFQFGTLLGLERRLLPARALCDKRLYRRQWH